VTEGVVETAVVEMVDVREGVTSPKSGGKEMLGMRGSTVEVEEGFSGVALVLSLGRSTTDAAAVVLGVGVASKKSRISPD